MFGGQNLNGFLKIILCVAAAAENVLQSEDQLLHVDVDLAAVNAYSYHLAAVFEYFHALFHQGRGCAVGVDAAGAVIDHVGVGTGAVDAVGASCVLEDFLLPVILIGGDCVETFFPAKGETVFTAVHQSNVAAGHALVCQSRCQTETDETGAQDQGDGLFRDRHNVCAADAHGHGLDQRSFHVRHVFRQKEKVIVVTGVGTVDVLRKAAEETGFPAVGSGQQRERRNAVAHLDSLHILSDFMDYAGDLVPEFHIRRKVVHLPAVEPGIRVGPADAGHDVFQDHVVFPALRHFPLFKR